MMVNLSVRMPADLHARLKELAEEEHRSLNSEIVHLLEQSIRDLTEGASR